MCISCIVSFIVIVLVVVDSSINHVYNNAHYFSGLFAWLCVYVLLVISSIDIIDGRDAFGRSGRLATASL